MKPTTCQPVSRRRFLQATVLASTQVGLRMMDSPGWAQDEPEFSLNYIVASCMYGTAPLSEIVPEVPKSGARYLEIWATPHGNQREQLDELGIEAMQKLLEEHHVQIGSFTCFKQGIFNMQEEMELVKKLGGDMVICNTPGPKDLTGDALKAEVQKFAEKLKPHVEFAEKLGITIGVENHGGGIISSRDSILWLFEMLESPRLGLALAPAHLPQDSEFIARLIRDLGNRLVHFQAWQKGAGFLGPVSKEQEILQLAHRGPLDWKPILKALKAIRYAGRTQIFMHPWPRGVPIRETTAEVTAEIIAGCRFLEARLSEIT